MTQIVYFLKMKELNYLYHQSEYKFYHLPLDEFDIDGKVGDIIDVDWVVDFCMISLITDVLVVLNWFVT